MVLFLLFVAFLLSPNAASSDSDSCHMHQYLRTKIGQKRFEQRNTRFWEFSEESRTWVEVKSGTWVMGSNQEPSSGAEAGSDQRPSSEKSTASHPSLGVRKRISLAKMSDHSIWVSGESGMIYERFWNGLQWVVAPHALPVPGVSVFFVGQRILALSESGHLYQIQLDKDSQAVWAELTLEFDKTPSKETIHLSSGVVTNDKERMYFCTKNGLLLEVLEINPPRWKYHGRPPGANVSAITDVDNFRPGLLFIISSSGDLYEYDQTSKPAWKKHIPRQGSTKDITALASSRGCILHGLVEPNSVSLFLLTKGGELIERRLQQRKWKWVVHGSPNGHVLTSITCISQDESNDQNSNLMLFTTAAGFVFQYHFQTTEKNWVNHSHPPEAVAARGISGLQLQPGRIIFPLDDGRLSELHLSGLGGGPNTPLSTRRKKASLKYVWSILDAPESEGWNAEYCTEQHGPTNCLSGTKDETREKPGLFSRRGKTQDNYLIPSRRSDVSLPFSRNDRLFRLRVMQEGKSFFLLTDKGETFECLNDGNAWFWLKHEHATRIRGIVGKYNGSLFSIDENGSLLMRERIGNELAWVNCSSMRRGKAVIGGPPWDSAQGQMWREDALFFIGKSGRLIQFDVGLRKLKWKDCRSPMGMKMGSIVDQEKLREKIVFVVGENGRLYQYNKVSCLWHEHYQSQHLVLSRSPGTAMRALGSLFMLSEQGGLVEYQWGSTDGWNWIEHGQPLSNVTLVGAPGPCFRGSEVFLIGSDGNVYRRYLDGGEWKWEDCGFPYSIEDEDEDDDGNCNPKVSSTRPIAFSENTVMFELQDGRMGELRRVDGSWMWSRAILTPVSLCMSN